MNCKITLLTMLFPLMANAGNNYVDLGLPSGLLWATCNIGAESPEQFGNYYNWTNNPVQEYWDNTWRTPTKAERDELVQYCTYSVETLNGVKGARYTGSNGNSIFFPFAGYYQAGNGPYKVGEGGQYWTITKYSDKEHWVLATNNKTQADNNAYYWPLTYFSFPVRPVTSETPTEGSPDIIINEENFPDENFRAFLKEQPYGKDDILTEEEIYSISKINVRNKKIKSLGGVEVFTALDSLICSFNQLTSLDVSKNTALTFLQCNNNQLASLDVTKNTALKVLACSYNKLTSIDVSKNATLTRLNCNNNQLTSLDVSKNTVLTSLNCNENQLASLDVSKNTALTELGCGGNQLTSLDVLGCTALTKLTCYNNQLTSLDVSKNIALTDLNCYNNQLTSLDVSKNTALTDLNCFNNQLTSLNVSKNTALTKLTCYDNKLTNLDVSKNIALTELGCYNNQLTRLDVSGCTTLTSLNCNENQLTSLDVSICAALTSLNCYKNQLTSLDVSKNIALTELDCYNNQLTSLDVSGCTALTKLHCYENQIKGAKMDTLVSTLPIQNKAELYIINPSSAQEGNICTKDQVNIAKKRGWSVYKSSGGYYKGSESEDHIIIKINEENFPDENFRAFLKEQWYGQDSILTEKTINSITTIVVSSTNIKSLKGIEFFTALDYLGCSGTQLTSLDVSKNTALTKLDINTTQLTSLDVSKNTSLKWLGCSFNQLTSLDVSKNTALEVLDCLENQLTSLDVSGCTALTYLGCSNNQLTNLDVSNNTALMDLVCGGNQLTSLDVSKCTALTDLNCCYNQLTSLDVSKCTALEMLNCSYNQLTSLDMSKNTSLKVLYCNDNQLTSLDVSKNMALTSLNCNVNQLTSIDVSGNTALMWLGCGGNQLTSLDVSKNTALTYLNCYENQIKGANMDALVSTLPIQNQAKLYIIKPSSDQEGNICTKDQVNIAKEKGWRVLTPTGEDYEGNDPASSEESPDIIINEESFPDANFRNFLLSEPYGNDGIITDEEMLSITYLGIGNKGISDLKGIGYFTALNILDCSANKLTSLDVSENTALTSLSCNNNQLSSLVLSNNTALSELHCYNNQIKGEAMDDLVGNLPQQNYARLWVINLSDSSEGNVCTEAQVNVAKEKGWGVCALRNYVVGEYEGADLTVEVDGIYYNLNTSDNTAKVTQHINGYSGDIDIPATIKYNDVTYNVTAIGNYAFANIYYNHSISSIKIPDSVISIGESAFELCYMIKSIAIPDNVRFIGKKAFYICEGLNSISLPQNLTSIEDELFWQCCNLTSVIIPADVKTIGNEAFVNCSNLTSLFIPNTLISIGESAFQNCEKLSSISLPDSLTNIGRLAFSGCTALSSITIPENVTKIGDYAFNGCNGLTSIIVEEDNGVFDSRDNCNAIIKKADNELIAGCSKTTIPNTVTSIGENAFNGQIELTSIKISSSVTTIKNGAFGYCSGLSSIVIPYSVTSIGNNPFYGCSGLTSIKVEDNNRIYDSRENCNAIIETATNELIAGCANTVIPNSVESIGEHAFVSCEGLTSLEIPNSVKTIGDEAFSNCKNLRTLNLGNGVKSIGRYAFSWCNSLASLVIPNSVESIGEHAFVSCEGLTSLEIPNSVTSVGFFAFADNRSLISLTVNMPTIDRIFYGCNSLTSLTIGNDVKSINNGFIGCSSITTVESQSPTPPTCQWPFEYNVYSQATLKVPTGSRTSYQMADYWKDFMNIEEFEPSSVQKAILDKKNDVPIYDLNGRRLKEPRKGINIIGGRKILRH